MTLTGWDLVTMSVRELQRIEVLSEVLARRRTEISAAAILGLSTRQTQRLLASFSFLSASFSLVQLKPAPDWFATMALRSSAPSGFYAHRSNCVRRLPSLRAGTAALAARTSTKDLFHLALDAAKACRPPTRPGRHLPL